MSDIIRQAEEMAEEKLSPRVCKSCKWAKPGYSGEWDFARCVNPEVIQQNLVTGDGEYCSITRLPLGICGVSGKLWEFKKRVKLKWWQKFNRDVPLMLLPQILLAMWGLLILVTYAYKHLVKP